MLVNLVLFLHLSIEQFILMCVLFRSSELIGSLQENYVYN